MTIEYSELAQAVALEAAAAASDGNKELAYSTSWRDQLGANPLLVARRNDTVVWRGAVPGLLPIVGRTLSIPATAVQSDIAAADIDTGSWTLSVQRASDPIDSPAVYQRVTLTKAGSGGEATLTDDLVDGGSVAVSPILINPPTLDTVGVAEWPTVNDSRRFAWVDPGETFASVRDNVGAHALYPWSQFSNSYWGYTKPLRGIPEPGLPSGYASEYYIERVADPGGSGKTVFRHRIDPNYEPLANTLRSQYLVPYLTDDTGYWIAWSVRMNSDCANVPSQAGTEGDGINLFDLHATGGSQIQSPLNCYYTASSDTFYFERRGFINGTLIASGWQSPVAPGFNVWHHFVFRVRLSRTSSANCLLQAWWAVGSGSKTQIFDMSGSMFGFSDMDPNTIFPKIGVYRWARDVRVTTHGNGLVIFRDEPGTPSITADGLLALLRSRVTA